MSNSIKDRLKKRRDAVHRRIGELRAELEVLEVRADEIERVWKDLMEGKGSDVALPPGLSPAKVAPGCKIGFGDLIIQAMTELARAGQETVDRKTIFDVIERAGYRFKSNSLRVALQRLEGKRVKRFGNLYSLIPETETAASEKAAA